MFTDKYCMKHIEWEENGRKENRACRTVIVKVDNKWAIAKQPMMTCAAVMGCDWEFFVVKVSPAVFPSAQKAREWVRKRFKKPKAHVPVFEWPKGGY